jgi:hypothetical protein
MISAVPTVYEEYQMKVQMQNLSTFMAVLAYGLINDFWRPILNKLFYKPHQ